MLKVNKYVGNFDEDPQENISVKLSEAKKRRIAEETEFSIHLWNNVNTYLFNFIDSVILTNVLFFFFSGIYGREKPSI